MSKSQIFDIIRNTRRYKMIGRREEIELLQQAYDSKESEFVAVYGRRRVGKTFLINEMFGGRFSFLHSGAENAGIKDQLGYFRESISKFSGKKCPRLTCWREAFYELARMLEASDSPRKIIFIDEAPWLDTPRSGFLTALEHFWNGWACMRKDVVLIICGSATSWIINEVLRNRGGLYNRVTKSIAVEPFTLQECEEYAKWRNLSFPRNQLAEYYMALGGIPYYWSLLRPGLSIAQNVDQLFFGKCPRLKGEYRSLMSSLFRKADVHVNIVNALSSHKEGLTREYLRKALNGLSGEKISACLEELEECGFIRRNPVIGKKKKGAIYQLIDPFLLFYYKFLNNRPDTSENFWQDNYGKPIVNAWRGLAFEVLCFWHIPQIKRALGISGISANVYSWRGRSELLNAEAQIDMLIDRSDGMINFCEMKYTNDEFVLTQDEERAIYRRESIFRDATKTRKGIAHTLVTSYNARSVRTSSVFVWQVVLDDLFA